jgi:hypothetical protein
MPIEKGYTGDGAAAAGLETEIDDVGAIRKLYCGFGMIVSRWGGF